VRYDPSLDIEHMSEVYNPSDDSYLLLRHVQISPGQTLLDMGCGTGLIGIHAAKAGAEVIAADVNPHAVECTRRNAVRNNLRIKTIESNLFEKIHGNFDVIAFNPPYLPDCSKTTSWVERAWSGGSEGTDIILEFMDEAWKHLSPGGQIVLILSSMGGLLKVLRAAKERYTTELLEEKHMFFESIYAYRLRPKRL